MEDKTQKEKIREFIRDIDNYVDYHGEADKEDIEPFIRKESLINFINQQFDLAIKETEERIVREIALMREPMPSANDHKEYNRGKREGVELIRNAVINLIRNK